MSKYASALMLATITFDRDSSVPLYRQLYDELRAAILSQRLVPGARLPSTREMAQILELSRATVVSAFEQLLAEGYLDGRVGAGTFVARVLPDDLLQTRRPMPVPPPVDPARHTLSRRGTLLAQTAVSPARDGQAARPFRPGTPDVSVFPFDLWAQLAARRYRNPPLELLGYGQPAGYQPLRTALASYLGTARAVRCHPDQIIIVSGSQQALDLAARLLLDEGDVVWVEDPGYGGARGAFSGAGARVVPVPVDGEGFDLATALTQQQAARLVYVTPSHQYPLGVTMSLKRRLALLGWADHAGAWLLEDDYDSEFRYVGRPLAALQGLDGAGRVIYVGTFSKVLFPGLRLGYIVAPPDLVDAFLAARALIDRHPPLLPQVVLTDFIEGGHFARHLRRMRALYGERQILLREAIQQVLAGRLEVQAAEAGMHLLGWLTDGGNERTIAARARTLGIDLPPLSDYCLLPNQRQGFLLGYAGFTPQAIHNGVALLARALA